MSFQTRKTFGTQMKIFLMKSVSFLTLHRQQGSYHGQGTETAWGWVIFIFGWNISLTALADSWLHLVKDSSDSFINIHHDCFEWFIKESVVRELVQNACSPSWELRTASPRGYYGERLQRDSCLKKHMKKHHPLAGDSPWRHYRRDHNIRTAGWIHHQLFRLHWLVCLKKRAFW